MEAWETFFFPVKAFKRFQGRALVIWVARKCLAFRGNLDVCVGRLVIWPFLGAGGGVGGGWGLGIK